MNKWVIFLMTNVHSAHSVVETSPALLTGPESRPMPSGPLDFSRHHFLKSWFCFVSVCGSLAVLGSVIRLTCFSSCNHCCYKNLLCLTLSWSCVMASSFCASGDFPALRSFLLLHFSIVSKNETHSKCFPVFSSHSSDLFALLHLPFFMFIFRINSCRLHCPLSLHFWSLLCVWNSWHLWPNCIFNTPDISLKLMKTVATVGPTVIDKLISSLTTSSSRMFLNKTPSSTFLLPAPSVCVNASMRGELWSSLDEEGWHSFIAAKVPPVAKPQKISQLNTVTSWTAKRYMTYSQPFLESCCLGK